MITRRQIRQFLAIVEAGSFTAASQQLHLTQPTLSSAISELERKIGAELFLRQPKGVRLTDAGRELLSHARAIESQFRRAERIGVDAPPGSGPPLRLGVLPTTPMPLLARVCKSWCDSGQPLQLSEGNDARLRRDLAAGHIDLAITLLHEPALAGPVLNEPYVMMFAQHHRLAQEPRLEPEALADETMIARRSCEILAETSRFFTRHGVRPRFLLRSANEERCMEMVRAGLGITTAPLSYATPGVTGVPVSGYDFRRRLGILPGPGKAVPPAFVDAWTIALS